MFDSISKGFKEIVAPIKEGLTALAESFSSGVKDIKENYELITENLGMSIGEKMTALGVSIGLEFAENINPISEAFDTFTEKWTTRFDNIKTWIDDVKETYKTVSANLGNTIAEKTTALGVAIGLKITENVDSIKLANSEFWQKVFKFHGDLFDWINSLDEKATNLLKSIFVPDSEYIQTNIDKNLKKLQDKGYSAFDMSFLFNNAKGIQNIEADVMGVHVTILRSDIVEKGISAFRPVIRGLIAFLLIFYNINNVLSLFHMTPISFGHHVKQEESKGE